MNSLSQSSVLILRFFLIARFTVVLRVAATAVSACVVCLPIFFAARPRTPLRVFCIAAFEYFARLRGEKLDPLRRLAIAHACDFGSLCDEFYDEQELNRTEYRSLRQTLRRIAPEPATTLYLQELRKAERTRPILSPATPDLAQATIDYRASVIALSLRWLNSISGSVIDRPNFSSLVSLICLMQLVDDLLDYHEDQVDRSPTYVTALLQHHSPTAPTNIPASLRTLASTLLQDTLNAARQNTAAIPFALAAFATWTFTVALINIRFPKNKLLRQSLANLEVGAQRPLLVRRETLPNLNLQKRILFFSDLHLRKQGPCHITKQLLAIASRECPDLILFGGDLVDSKNALASLHSLVRKLSRFAPVCAVAGNHDHWVGLQKVRAAIREAGGHWLEDAPFFLTPNCALYGSLEQPLQSATYHLLCTHHPTASTLPFHLTLSGHLHGGQFVACNHRGRLYPGAFLYRWNGLRFDDPHGRTLLISRGVQDTFPLRWNCPREVLLVDL